VQVRQQVRHLRAAPGSRETAARGAGIWGKTNGVEPLDSFWNIKTDEWDGTDSKSLEAY
jgi:hypothetical protein